MTSDKSCDLKGRQKIFHIYQNLANSCCRSNPVELDPSKKLDYYLDLWQNEKAQLAQGIEVLSCEQCWKTESQGIISYRQYHHMGHDIEIYLSNLCNHMCSYCNAKFSSVWQESIETYGVFKNISITAQNNQKPDTLVSTLEDHWLEEIKNHIAQQDDNSVTIKLLGGEPLMQIKNLQKFLDFNNSKIKKLTINTNLNPPSNRFLIWILNNFPKEKLQFAVSLDTVPENNAVSRAGFDQERFETNLELLKQYQVKFFFLPVISALTIFYHDEFTQWLEKNQYQASIIKLSTPDFLDAAYLPLEFRNKILESGKHLPKIAVEVLSTSQSSIDLKLFEQYNYLNQYFSRAGIHPNNIKNQLFGEYWNWLANKKFY